jgi:hypothetical protein
LEGGQEKESFFIEVANGRVLKTPTRGEKVFEINKSCDLTYWFLFGGGFEGWKF